MKPFTAFLLLAPAFLFAVGVCFGFVSTGVTVVFLSLSGLSALACFAWGIWLFRSHRKLAWICLVVAGLYLTGLALSLHPAKASGKRSQQRAGGDGGITVLVHAGRAWPAAPQHGRSASQHFSLCSWAARRKIRFGLAYAALSAAPVL